MKDLKDNNGINGQENGNETVTNEVRETESAKEKTYKLPFVKNPVRKITLIRIISISAAAVVAVVALILGLVLGLRGSKQEFTVTFESADHVEYSCGLFGDAAYKDGEIKVTEGDTVTFSLIIDEGYTQAPRVTANDNVVSLVSGSYSFTVKENVTVKVTEVFEIAIELSGSGTENAPWVLTSAREINFVAQNVNNGIPAYIQGYYRLNDDIDCNGAELNVIGNGRTQSSFFSGYFNGAGHKISNFVINSNAINYVGLFGYVQTSGTGTDSLGTITGLHLDNFTINAYASDTANVFVGAFIGYGAGANLINCSATNGKINVFGSGYFSYVGGAVGAQQSASAMATDGSLFPFYSVVNKVYTDVDIFSGSGYILGAGGITGFVFSEHEMSQSIITNSYSCGGIYGALRSGGIAGILDNYSAISNCYSAGEIEAYSSVAVDGMSVDLSAFAGGIVGYSGLNTVVSDSFSTASTYAKATNGSKFEHTDGLVAGVSESTVTERAIVINNCEHLNSVPNATYIKNTLGWRDCDWVITDGALPVINTSAAAQNAFTVSLDYNGKTVKGESVSAVNVTFGTKDFYYKPLSGYFFMSEALFERTYVSDDAFTSFGYFFDKELTKKAPYGYIPLRETTLYIGFADYSEVAGTYIYNNGKGRTVALTLDVSGEYVYEDGLTQYSSYSYDGENIVLYDALFARYSDKERGDSPNLFYDEYHFAGIKEGNTLKLYDGEYFTADRPIEFNKSGSAATNAFIGVWEKSATINKKYEFKSDNSWTLKRGDKVLDSGTYSVTDGVATLKTGVEAKINSNGLLSVDGELYCYENSYFGTWFDVETGSYISFNGYGSNLTGEVIVNLNNSLQRLIYVYDGFFDDGARSVTLLNPEDMSLFGYLTLKNNVLSGVLYSSAAGGFVDAGNFRLTDDYVGEWITEQDGGYKIINFNGFGIYNTNQNGAASNSGYVEIDGIRYEYTVDPENELKGSFYIGGVKYELEFNDDTKTVTISQGADKEVYGRKDIMYEYPLIDDDGNIYRFNGGSALSIGGELEVTKTDGTTETFNYKITDSKTDDNNNLKDVTINLNNGVGSITVVNNKLIFKATASADSIELYLYLPYSSTTPWAVTDNPYNFTIGKFDLSYTAKGKFMNMEGEATYTYNKSGGYVSVPYITGSMTSYTTEYLILLDDGNIAISSYPYLVAGDYLYSAPQDEMYGVWYYSQDKTRTLQFDGVADSKYTSGVVREFVANTNVNSYFYTRRFGKIYLWQYNDDSKVYVLESVAYTAVGENIINNGARRAYKITEFVADETPVCSVTDGETEYAFYLDGSLTEDGKKGSYELLDVNENTVSLIIHMAGDDDRTAEIDVKNKTIRFIG